ncbi:helicase 2 [Tipula oleracea nudivirus]|uniref:Helicase 2 n=1 Tax=Tipula oleracea nudivirus TaxID=1546257 RepID=A0A0B4VFM0_9VIRU|nr:helicase 2 [Tipula oleracea nudivirus]AJD20165.1 helicase 2 [Tipula oleracea nudivirus]
MLDNYQFNKTITNLQDRFRELPTPKGGMMNVGYLIDLALCENLDNNVELNFQPYRSLDVTRKKICNKIYSILDGEQKNKFLLLHRIISDSYYHEDENSNQSKKRKMFAVDYNAKSLMNVNKPVLISIDAKAGVGKSFFEVAFITTYHRPVNIYIFSHVLIAPLKRHPNIKSATIASFKMQIQLHFKSSFRYNNPYVTPFDGLIRILAFIGSIKTDKIYSDLMIIDEYTVLEPEMLLIFYFYSLKYNKNLIFSGDSKQLNSIQTSQFHTQSNLKILNILATESITLEVVKRSTDVSFNKLVDKLRLLTVGGNTSLTYNIEHDIFIDHEYKFYSQSDYTSTLLASRHSTLTKRIKEYIEYMDANQIKYYISPYFVNVKDDRNSKIKSFKVESSDDKFCPWLLLVENDLYEYIKKTDKDIIEKIIVRLDAIAFMYIGDCPIASKLYATNVHTGEKYEILREELLESYFITNEYLIWLNNNALKNSEYTKRTYPVFQFPLKSTKISTYHSIQGSTISQNKIEINMDHANMESIYVGFSRVSDYSLINKLYTKQLYSHMLTKILNYFDDDQYYYKIGNTYTDKEFIGKLSTVLNYLNHPNNVNILANLKHNQNLIKESTVKEYIAQFQQINYFEVDDYSKFESMTKRNAKIKKREYDKVTLMLKEKNDEVSSLMILTKFIKKHNKELLKIITPKVLSFEPEPKCFFGPNCFRYIYENYNGVNKLKNIFADFYKQHYPDEYINKLNFIFSDTMQLYPKFKDTGHTFEFKNKYSIDLRGVNKYDIISRKYDARYNQNDVEVEDYFNDDVYNFFNNPKNF